MTNSKVLNSDSAYSITFSQVLWYLLTLLIDRINIEIQTFLQIRIWIQHSISAFPSNGQTDRQTDRLTTIVI